MNKKVAFYLMILSKIAGKNIGTGALVFSFYSSIILNFKNVKINWKQTKNSRYSFFFLSFIALCICSEQSIIGARASVMVYDDNQKKWIPSGTSSGLSKVHIYHHQQNNTFRVVGRKLQDHEVVINCSILKGLKYNQATPTFHQWRDSKFVYGLNFSSQQDAEAFARAMLHALEVCCINFLNLFISLLIVIFNFHCLENRY